MELFDYNVEIILHHRFIHPREVISGDVKIKVQTALFLTHAYIEIVGTAQCQWENPGKFNLLRKRMPQKFSGSQDFFYCRHTLAGNDGSEVIMEKRSYYFPFKCKLPGHLPASWSGEYGDIKYIAKVVIKGDEEIIGVHSKELEIVPYRNLSFETNLMLEAKQTVTRKFRFGLLSLGTVTVSLWMPICGIAAGQCLPVICTIDNQSTVLFGGIIFVLTQIEIYRSKKPYYAIKTIRKDVCRVARLTDILRGRQEYYCVLKTEKTNFPTTQFFRCSTCQLIYEVWVQIQGSLPSNNAYGYPNIDLPGTAIIVGTHPAIQWDINEINQDVMKTLLRVHGPISLDPVAPTEIVEEILNTADDEYDAEMMLNLTRQMNSNDTASKKSRDSGSMDYNARTSY